MALLLAVHTLPLFWAGATCYMGHVSEGSCFSISNILRIPLQFKTSSAQLHILPSQAACRIPTLLHTAWPPRSSFEIWMKSSWNSCTAQSTNLESCGRQCQGLLSACAVAGQLSPQKHFLSQVALSKPLQLELSSQLLKPLHLTHLRDRIWSIAEKHLGLFQTLFNFLTSFNRFRNDDFLAPTLHWLFCQT